MLALGQIPGPDPLCARASLPVPLAKFRGSHLSNATCLNTCFLQMWRIMQQINLAVLDR